MIVKCCFHENVGQNLIIVCFTLHLVFYVFIKG